MNVFGDSFDCNELSDWLRLLLVQFSTSMTVVVSASKTSSSKSSCWTIGVLACALVLFEIIDTGGALRGGLNAGGGNTLISCSTRCVCQFEP